MASISDTLLQRLHDLGGTVTSESNTLTYTQCTHTLWLRNLSFRRERCNLDLFLSICFLQLLFLPSWMTGISAVFGMKVGVTHYWLSIRLWGWMPGTLPSSKLLLLLLLFIVCFIRLKIEKITLNCNILLDADCNLVLSLEWFCTHLIFASDDMVQKRTICPSFLTNWIVLLWLLAHSLKTNIQTFRKLMPLFWDNENDSRWRFPITFFLTQMFTHWCVRLDHWLGLSALHFALSGLNLQSLC